MGRQKLSVGIVGGHRQSSLECTICASLVAVRRLPLAPRLRKDAFLVFATASEAWWILWVVHS
jgi:hypothetical protein